MKKHKEKLQKAISISREKIHAFLKKDQWTLEIWRKRIIAGGASLREFFPASSLSIKDQAFFARRLSFLITGEVPLLESLRILRKQTKSKQYGHVLDTVINDVSNGQYLSKSFGKFPDMFGEFAINMIRVGETSGILSQNLNHLADELSKKQALKRRIIGAMVYPCIITLATLGITLFLTVYLFPKLMPVLLSLHMALPLSTRIVIAISVFLREWGIALACFIALFVIAFIMALKRSERFSELFDQYILKIPIIGTLIQNYNLTNITRTLGMLLKSGMSLSVALRLTAETNNNLVYRKHLNAVGEAVKRGEEVSVHLAKYPELFSDVLSQMIAVGERSGNLSDTLLYLAEFYEREVDDLAKDFSGLIEPAMMVFMGVIVGFVAISIITPIYGITQNLHP